MQCLLSAAFATQTCTIDILTRGYQDAPASVRHAKANGVEPGSLGRGFNFMEVQVLNYDKKIAEFHTHNVRFEHILK